MSARTWGDRGSETKMCEYFFFKRLFICFFLSLGGEWGGGGEGTGKDVSRKEDGEGEGR